LDENVNAPIQAERARTRVLSKAVMLDRARSVGGDEMNIIQLQNSNENQSHQEQMNRS
jgi:hypothetical protein